MYPFRAQREMVLSSRCRYAAASRKSIGLEHRCDPALMRFSLGLAESTLHWPDIALPYTPDIGTFFRCL